MKPITDYAMPMMIMEKLLRQLHDECLMGRYKEANELTPKLIAEARVLQATLALMAEKK